MVLSIEEYRKEVVKMPPDFGMASDPEKEWFTDGGWGFSGISVHRDSDALSRSNWTVISKDMLERFPDSFDKIHCGHWAVGWIDHLAVDSSDEKAIDALLEWESKLEDYPVADEEHFSCTEIDDENETWENCISRDYDIALGEEDNLGEDWEEEVSLEFTTDQLRWLFDSVCHRINEYWRHDSSGPWIDVEKVAANTTWDDVEKIQAECPTVGA